MPKIDIVQEAQERLEAAWAHDRENREDAFTDLKFLAGDQWPNAIRQQREAQNRPCLTINRLPQFVNQVANTVRMNPPAIKAIPAGGEATQDWPRFIRGCSGRSNTARTPRMSSPTRSIMRSRAASGISGSSPTMWMTTLSIRKS